MTDTQKATRYDWDGMPREALSQGVQRSFFTSDRMMVAKFVIDKGTVIPRHAHESEQVTFILEGALHFSFGPNGEEEMTVSAGEVVVIPSNLPHSAVAIEDTIDIDVFDPPRQDWLSQSDDYLRG